MTGLAATRRYQQSHRAEIKRRAQTYYAKNRGRIRARQAKYREANREHLRDKSRQRNRRSLACPTRPCPDVCECCGRRCQRALALDHDHSTGRFRGWLCFACNTGLGKLGDDAAGLRRALTYLERVSV